MLVSRTQNDGIRWLPYLRPITTYHPLIWQNHSLVLVILLYASVQAGCHIKVSNTIWCTWAQTLRASNWYESHADKLEESKSSHNNQPVFWPRKQQPHALIKREGWKKCRLTCKLAAAQQNLDSTAVAESLNWTLEHHLIGKAKRKLCFLERLSSELSLSSERQKRWVSTKISIWYPQLRRDPRKLPVSSQ